MNENGQSENEILFNFYSEACKGPFHYEIDVKNLWVGLEFVIILTFSQTSV